MYDNTGSVPGIYTEADVLRRDAIAVILLALSHLQTAALEWKQK